MAAAVNAAVPARAATSAIPIVCPALADAVHLGLIASEARPGGNVTGIEPYVAGLPAKQMEFAREIAPGATRIGLLTNLQDPKAPPQRQELVSAAKALELAIAEAVIYVATAPKSNAAYAAYGAAMRTAREAGSLVPPKHILNAPTKLMQAQGYGEGYDYDHDAPEAFSGQDYFPEQLDRQKFYDPPERGFEREIRKRLEYWEKLRRERNKSD